MNNKSVEIKKSSSNKIINFMGGNSYEINPLDTLKMVTASSIFGEPTYYIDGDKKKSSVKYQLNSYFEKYSILPNEYKDETTNRIMEKVIDNALDYSFGDTLEWAVQLRTNFYMRLNPQIIIVRAAIHPKRIEFNEANPGLFKDFMKKIMYRTDDSVKQLSYWLEINGTKQGIPSILKRGWANQLSNASPRNIYKYRNIGKGLIDTVRICHANSPAINELMKTGTVSLNDSSELTWERLRSEGKSWAEILDTIQLGHMALLRNLKNIFLEINDIDLCNKLLDQLKSGVKNGKQFPFRYYNAYNVIKNSGVHHLSVILSTLEECIDISRVSIPKLKGKTICLSDNSGSAWSPIHSDYGSVKVAEIGNLSSVITAQNSDEGYVGVFGDKLEIIPITENRGCLLQTKECTDKGSTVGSSTENGIWIFFDNAIKECEKWDNIFVYSDMQAGHGGLYGKNPQEYKDYICKGKSRHIDVMKLVEEYRKKVNPNVNVFMIQTAGYNNVLIPEYAYRTNVLFGWTGKETLFAKTMIDFWDERINLERGAY